MVPPITHITCESCGGIGTRPGPLTGRALKRERRERGVSFNHILPHFPYSKTYLADLEAEKKPFSNKLVAQYLEAIELAVQARLMKQDAKQKVRQPVFEEGAFRAL